jgi:hypothetical protein
MMADLRFEGFVAPSNRRPASRSRISPERPSPTPIPWPDREPEALVVEPTGWDASGRRSRSFKSGPDGPEDHQATHSTRWLPAIRKATKPNHTREYESEALEDAIPSGLETWGFTLLGRSHGDKECFFSPWYFLD